MALRQALSPRGPHRGLVFLGLGVLVVAAVVGVLWVRHTLGARPSAITADQRALGPVILVPGYGGSTESLAPLAARLEAVGRRAEILQLAGDGTGDLRVQAQRLGQAVDEALAGGAPSVDVVGYSAGGVVARWWATQLGGVAHTRRIVLLGTPNHGAEVAGIGAAFGGSACPVACQQLAPDSELLATLNTGDPTPSGPQWVSVWTDQDDVVTPPDSARLDGALEVVVQQVCPAARVAHGDLPTAPAPQGIVLRALASALMTAPSEADCAALSS